MMKKEMKKNKFRKKMMYSTYYPMDEHFLFYDKKWQKNTMKINCK